MASPCPAPREGSSGAAGGPLPGALAARGPPSAVLPGEGPRPAGRPRRGGPPGLGCRRTARRRALRRRREGRGPPAASQGPPLGVAFGPDEALYIDKEVFLRELIANALAALDRARFEHSADPEKGGELPFFYVKILLDKTNSTIAIGDSGIGMTKDELTNKLGTSAGPGGSFAVQLGTELEHGEVKRGTKVICRSGEGSEDLEERLLKDLARRHSEFNGSSAELPVEKPKEKDLTGLEDEELWYDKANSTISIEDSGIGMNKNELINEDEQEEEKREASVDGEETEEESSDGDESEGNPLDLVFDAVVALTREREWASIKEVAKEAGMDEEDAKYWVDAWQQLNVVEVISKGRKQKVKMRKGVTEALGR
uniref:Histidine kinase/HSP90-like ATPase domain-containing protein n=1 Tax=Alexandrium monilatum TaxID=311494 RepID=A0A7S4ST54_9DINO